jgi:diguanylate cyclase (GGDEF)-like protein
MLNRKSLLTLVMSVPIIIIASIAIWGMSALLDRAADTIDRHEQLHISKSVNVAFSRLEQTINSLARDNAEWDEAVLKTADELDRGWIEQTWGPSSSSVNYDTVFVLDGAKRPIAAYRNGKAFSQTPQSYYGEGFSRLVALGSQGSPVQDTGLIVNTADGLSAASLRPILATLAGSASKDKARTFLLFSKAVTKESLAEIARQLDIGSLTVLPVDASSIAPPNRATGHGAEEGRHREIIRAADGVAVGVAHWPSRNPGSVVRAANFDAARLILLIILALLLPTFFLHYRTVKGLKRSETEARSLALVDSMSGLPNRKFLLEELQRRMSDPQAKDLALLFVDLDGFKAVNDAFDHATGDALIKAFGEGLTGLMSARETAARLGGDEFAILISGTEAEARAAHVARRVIAFARQPFNLDGRIASIGASVGIAFRAPDVADPTELMRRADIAMYDAKESGRNQWRVFDGSLDQHRSDNLLIANELRSYLERGKMNVAFQPIVDARSQTIAGVEVLARWPGLESHGPDRFIPIAEEHGLIDALSAAVLRKAMTELRAHPGLKLSLNVSALQINNPAFASDLLKHADEMGFNHRMLQLEFTESQLIRNPKPAKKLIAELQQLGISVALDDFGTGFASLGYLHEFAFNTIKLDKSLAKAIVSDKVAQQVITGTVMIAKGLSAEIVAEGIESEDQASFMYLAGCSYLQGYYFSRPVPADELKVMLAVALQPPQAALAG